MDLVEISRLTCLARGGGGGFDGLSYPAIGTATANMPLHCRVDIFVRWVGVALQQGRGCHDLAALAIATLGHLFLDPGQLHSMRVI